LPPLDEKYKTPENIIQGCQSRVWLQTDYRDGKLYFRAESDAVIVKGLLALVLRVFSGRTPDEILGADLRFMKEIGLTEHLSPRGQTDCWLSSNKSGFMPWHTKQKRNNNSVFLFLVTTFYLLSVFTHFDGAIFSRFQHPFEKFSYFVVSIIIETRLCGSSLLVIF